MTHGVENWSVIETKETAYELADRLVKELAERGYDVTCHTRGFRAEFDGVPVLELPTGEFREGNPFYHSSATYEVMEYAVIETQEGKAYLGDYYGLAGVRWSGKARSTLEDLFTGSEIEGEEEIPRGVPEMKWNICLRDHNAVV